MKQWILAAALGLLPVPAGAHAILIGGTPAAGQRVPAGDLVVELRFNSRVDASRSRVTIVPEGAAGETLTLDADPAPGTLTGRIALRPGAYTLRWQVLAVDGHITRGVVPFTAGP